MAVESRFPEAMALRKEACWGCGDTLIQTLMFDLPIVQNEVRDLMREDVAGGGKRVSR